MLTAGALTVVYGTFADGFGREWARVGQPFLVLMAALGASTTATRYAMKELADSWSAAAPQSRQSYLVAFDAASRVTEALFFAAFFALGLYLAALGTAILCGRLYARWIGWTAAGSAVLVLSGNLLELASDAAFAAVLAGFGLFVVLVITLGVSMWRQAGRLSSNRAEGDSQALVPQLARPRACHTVRTFVARRSTRALPTAIAVPGHCLLVPGIALLVRPGPPTTTQQQLRGQEHGT